MHGAEYSVNTVLALGSFAPKSQGALVGWVAVGYHAHSQTASVSETQGLRVLVFYNKW